MRFARGQLVLTFLCGFRVCIYIYIYIYICIQTRMHIQTWMHIHIYIYIYVCTSTLITCAIIMSRTVLQAKRVHFRKFWFQLLNPLFHTQIIIKNIKELFWISFLEICCSPYITHREAIEVQMRKLSNQQNEQYLRVCMELRFQIWFTHTLT